MTVYPGGIKVNTPTKTYAALLSAGESTAEYYMS